MSRAASHRRLRRQAGIAMVLVMIAVAVSMVIVMGYIASQSTSIAVSRNLTDHTQARLNAESGLSMAIKYVRTSDTWRTDRTQGTWVADQPHAGGTFTIVAEDGEDTDGDGTVDGDGLLDDDVADKLTLTVTGRFGRATHVSRAVLTPESAPNKMLLLIAADADRPGEQTSAKQSLLESLGYTVKLVDDAAGSATFSEQLAEADVVYIASNVSDDLLRGKVERAAIGIVCESVAAHDELGISDSSGRSHVSDAIAITVNTHDITAGFGLDDVTITASGSRLIRLHGNLADGAVVLATRHNNAQPTLAILDRGAVTADGSPAPGRRVVLPWGDRGWDIRQLTSDGRTLLERALTWAGASGSGWVSSDVGDYEPAGSDSHAGGTFTIEAAGTDIWDRADQFRFVYQPLTGDGELIARVTAAPETDAWSKAGVMVRETLDPGSRHTLMAVTGNSGVALQRRRLTNGVSEHTGDAGSAPHYVRIVREGDRISGYASATGMDGTWHQIGPDVTLWRLPDTVYIGLAVTSHAPGRLGTATFDHVVLDAPGNEEDDEAPEPQLLVQYEFEEVIQQPQLLHHWPLNETASGGGGLAVENAVTLYHNARIDAYDASQGSYERTQSNAGSVSTNTTGWGRVTLRDQARIGADVRVGPGGDPDRVITTHHQSVITGSRAALLNDVPMPSIDAPANMPRNEGHQTYRWSDRVVIDSDRHFRKLTLQHSATVTIQGDVTILCDNTLDIRDQAKLVVPPGSSLALYVNKGVNVRHSARLNADPLGASRLFLYMISPGHSVNLFDQAQVAGQVYSANNVELRHNARLFGSILARDSLRMSDQAAIHLDKSLPAIASAAAPPAEDVVGGHDGEYEGATPGGAGRLGYAPSFDSNDYLLIPHADTMLLDAGTVSFWFNSADLSGRRGLLSKDATGYNDGGHLHIETDGPYLRARLQSTSATHVVESSASLVADTWHHVALTFGPTGLRLYLDGNLMDTADYFGGLGSSSGGSGNAEPLVLGADASSSQEAGASPLMNHFRGRIDDLRIYDRPLDTGQIQNLNGGGEAGPVTSPGYVVADTAGYGQASNLYITDPEHVTWLAGGGLQIDSPTVIRTLTADLKLPPALAATDEMTLVCKFVPHDLLQPGPAPIFAQALDSTQRNFAFNQNATHADWRLRTSNTRLDGTPATAGTTPLATGAVQQVIVTYDGEQVRIWHNGEPDSTRSLTGSFNTWAPNHFLVMANELAGDRPWLGKLLRIAVYDRALNALQVEDVTRGDPPGRYDDAQDVTFSVRWIETP